MPKTRLDHRLVELGLESSGARAQALIRAGKVWLGDRRLDKPGALIASDSMPEVRGQQPFVSRGGLKLAGALDALGLEPDGLRCADVGASTGGFTDCLLQRGARSVFAIDVGYGQLAWSLRSDPRVVLLERTNVRHYALPEDVAPFDLVTADLSFISLSLVLPQLAALARPGGSLLALVKPQFELEREDVESGGVVRDPEKRRAAVDRVRRRAAELGLVPEAEAESTLPGPKGNREIFLLLQKSLEPR